MGLSGPSLTATLYKDHDWQLCLCRDIGWAPDICGQAILINLVAGCVT
jgi:hypothetical protein